MFVVECLCVFLYACLRELSAVEAATGRQYVRRENTVPFSPLKNAMFSGLCIWVRENSVCLHKTACVCFYALT